MTMRPIIPPEYHPAGPVDRHSGAMRASQSFTVRQRVPDALAGLGELSMNLRWSWDGRTRDLFRWVDPDAWEVTHHDPVGLLGQVSAATARAPGRRSRRSRRSCVRCTTTCAATCPPTGGSRAADTELRAIAYFSPEFGIAEALPQYSGGLGVLAGDHLKAASGLGLPVVGVGLFYRQGYFRQELNDDGWQQERYVTLDPHGMALHPVEGGASPSTSPAPPSRPRRGGPTWGACGSTCSTPTSRPTHPTTG